MAIYNLGRILPFFKGDYVEGETYKKLDLVYVKGVGTYVANQTTSEYPVDNEEWTLVCENGKKGDKGEDGITEEEARTIIEAYNYITMQDVEYKNYTTMSEVEAKGYLTEVPDTYATKTWVEDKNYLTQVPSEYVTETELASKNYTTMALVEAKNYLTQVPDTYATKTWVEDKNYLTEIPSEYVTETELEAKGYTTMADVEAKGYLTQVPAGYATETWVEDKNYLTEHQPLKTINNESIVGTGNIEIQGDAGIIFIDRYKRLTNDEFDDIKNKLDTYEYTVIFKDATLVFYVCRYNNEIAAKINVSGIASDIYSLGLPCQWKAEYTKGGTLWKFEIKSVTLSDDLTTYAQKTWVEDQGYTTMAAVEAKHYLTSVPAGYATESYVDTKIGDINTALATIIGA